MIGSNFFGGLCYWTDWLEQEYVLHYFSYRKCSCFFVHLRTGDRFSYVLGIFYWFDK